MPNMLSPAPNHFPALAAIMDFDQRQLERVADLKLGLDRDLGLARRQVDDGAFALPRAAGKCQPGAVAVHAGALAVALSTFIVAGRAYQVRP